VELYLHFSRRLHAVVLTDNFRPCTIKLRISKRRMKFRRSLHQAKIFMPYMEIVFISGLTEGVHCGGICLENFKLETRIVQDVQP
jgi:hypothetical protein